MACFSRKNLQSEKSKKIDQDLKKLNKHRSKEAKILLLGPGESGKSTIFKQMKLIQDNGGFTEEERLDYKHVVLENTITQMRSLVEFAARSKQPFDTQENMELAAKFLSMPEQITYSLELAQMIKKLWADKGLKQLFLKANTAQFRTLQLQDTADYFFENTERFALADYIPDIDDVLRVRVRSVGIEEAEFHFDKTIFRVIDVGGQRSERKKWIQCFERVQAILFCVALNGYDQTLREKNTVNRMEEALDLFEEVSNSSYFADTAIILFLNKIDLFEEKIKRVPLKECPLWPNYEGGEDYIKAKDFVGARFTEVVQNNTKIFIHYTCAVDTENIVHVINDVRENALSQVIGTFLV